MNLTEKQEEQLLLLLKNAGFKTEIGFWNWKTLISFNNKQLGYLNTLNYIFYSSYREYNNTDEVLKIRKIIAKYKKSIKNKKEVYINEA
jgi:hypothetical protein